MCTYHVLNGLARSMQVDGAEHSVSRLEQVVYVHDLLLVVGHATVENPTTYHTHHNELQRRGESVYRSG